MSIEKILTKHMPETAIRGCSCGLRHMARPLPDPGEFEAAWAAHVVDLIREAMTGNEVVEAVAEAIHASDCGCPDWHADDQEDQTYTEHARAALAAVATTLGGDQ